MKNKRFWNLPNTITVFRMLMVPVMVVLLWAPPSRNEAIAATTVFVVAMLSDVLDGYLARKWDLVSPMGAYLDPLADKLMVATTLIMLVPIGWVPAWIVVLLLCREMSITGLRGIASQEGLVLSAGTLGKVKTAYQSTALGMLLLHYPTLGIDWHSTGIATLWIATFFAVVSALQYFIQFARQTRLA